MAKWLVHCTTKLATWVRFSVAAEISTDNSVLGYKLTRYCFQQCQPRLDNRGGN